MTAASPCSSGSSSRSGTLRRAVSRRTTRGLQLPRGAESLHLEDAYVHHQMVRRIFSLFSSWGYLPLETPVLDFFDVYQPLMEDGADAGWYRHAALSAGEESGSADLRRSRHCGIGHLWRRPARRESPPLFPAGDAAVRRQSHVSGDHPRRSTRLRQAWRRQGSHQVSRAVESGRTLAAHDLVEVAELAPIHVRLIANPAYYKVHYREVEAVVGRITGRGNTG